MGFSDLKNAIKKIDQSLKEKNRAKEGGANSGKAQQSYPSQNKAFQPSHNIVQVPLAADDDIFAKPIATSEPPSIFKTTQHAQPPQGCSCGESDEPIQTNNFSNNLTLGDQTFPVWTLPYSLWYTTDPDQDVGFAFNHTDASQRVFGPDPDSNPAQFYFNPPKIKSFVISGANFRDNNVSVRLENHNKLSVTSKLVLDKDPDKNVTVPLVHGMGYVTAIYNNIQPVIASQVGFQDFKQLGLIGNVSKYKVTLFNQVVWSLYVAGDASLKLNLQDPNHIVANKVSSNAMIQICRGESKHYDSSCGIYADSCHLQGSCTSGDGKKCQYKFVYGMKGNSKSGNGIVWCLPHHQEVLTNDIKKRDTKLELDSTTKGVMKAYATNELIMEEIDLPVNINWEPWSSLGSFNGDASYSENAKRIIRSAAEEEVQQDVVGMANIDSMYTSGKILDKFAYIAYVCHFVLQDDKLTSIIFPKVKEAVEIFARNHQKFPLVYDLSWKGLISSAEPGADFGNSNYNDHHFHYGYHIHAIALLAKVDESFENNEWLHANNNLVLDYTLTLLRDVANPSKDDKYFPVSRSFDWYHGHSFAHGIFASGDGKDEESSSEDYHFAYGMKLFAKIINDSNMEVRANLMLAIMRRSMNMYMLYSDDNKIQPKRFIKNKVAGISFENKIDFATYFGRGQIADEWIHGIHMLPITPISSYIRNEGFVQEEWDQKLAGIVNQITDGWKGILMLNFALVNPKQSWKWFSRKDWDNSMIDNGMSRTWSLAYIAGVGGSD